jgi:hypothetical protein
MLKLIGCGFILAAFVLWMDDCELESYCYEAGRMAGALATISVMTSLFVVWAPTLIMKNRESGVKIMRGGAALSAVCMLISFVVWEVGCQAFADVQASASYQTTGSLLLVSGVTQAFVACVPQFILQRSFVRDFKQYTYESI